MICNVSTERWREGKHQTAKMLKSSQLVKVVRLAAAQASHSSLAIGAFGWEGELTKGHSIFFWVQQRRGVCGQNVVACSLSIWAILTRRPSKPPWCLLDGLFFFLFVSVFRDCTACVAQLFSGLISFDDDHDHGFCQIRHTKLIK